MRLALRLRPVVWLGAQLIEARRDSALGGVTLSEKERDRGVKLMERACDALEAYLKWEHEHAAGLGAPLPRNIAPACTELKIYLGRTKDQEEDTEPPRPRLKAPYRQNSEFVATRESLPVRSRHQAAATVRRWVRVLVTELTGLAGDTINPVTHEQTGTGVLFANDVVRRLKWAKEISDESSSETSF